MARTWSGHEFVNNQALFFFRSNFFENSLWEVGGKKNSISKRGGVNNRDFMVSALEWLGHGLDMNLSTIKHYYFVGAISLTTHCGKWGAKKIQFHHGRGRIIVISWCRLLSGLDMVST